MYLVSTLCLVVPMEKGLASQEVVGVSPWSHLLPLGPSVEWAVWLWPQPLTCGWLEWECASLIQPQIRQVDWMFPGLEAYLLT